MDAASEGVVHRAYWVGNNCILAGQDAMGCVESTKTWTAELNVGDGFVPSGDYCHY